MITIDVQTFIAIFATASVATIFAISILNNISQYHGRKIDTNTICAIYVIVATLYSASIFIANILTGH
jgi:hypothetical protein